MTTTEIEDMLRLVVPVSEWLQEESELVCRYSVSQEAGNFVLYRDGSRYIGSFSSIEALRSELRQQVRQQEACASCRGVGTFAERRKLCA